MLINGVECDTYAHIDRKLSGETIIFNIGGDKNSITAYLLFDWKPFFVNGDLEAECCIKDVDSGFGNDRVTVSATIGAGGEITFVIPSSYKVDGKNLYCEINISGIDNNGNAFRYKASNFRVHVMADGDSWEEPEQHDNVLQITQVRVTAHSSNALSIE